MSDERTNPKSLAIACASGSFKGAFVHGVLSALETAGIRANAYAAASSAVFSCVRAAVGIANEDSQIWHDGLQALKQTNGNMSQMILQGISAMKLLQHQLLQPGQPHLYIATSAVITPEAAEQTQGKQARRLGRRLLLSAAQKDRSWVDENLKLVLFSTKNANGEELLNASNFDEVVYASTRMLHAWDFPAWIAKKPFVDASYTCLCPAMEMVDAGYEEAIAIATEPGTLYRDIFQLEAIPQTYKGVPIHIIRPDFDPKEVGVDFTDATLEGLSTIYRHGEEKGKEFLARWQTVIA